MDKAAEKARLLAKEEAAAKIAAEERARKIAAEDRAAKEKQLAASDALVGRMAQGGIGDSAAAAYNQSNALRKELYGLAGPQIMGSANPNVYDRETRQPMRDYNNPQTLAMLQQMSGVKPELKDVAPFHTVINPATGQPVYTAPGMVGGARSGYSFVDPNGGGGQMMPPPMVGGGVPPQPAGGSRMVVPPSAPAARGGGGRRSSGGGRGRTGGRGGVTWDAPDANGYQTGSNGQVRRVPGFAVGGKPQADTDYQDKAIARVKAMPSYRDMDDDQYNAAVAKTERALRAAAPTPQPQRPAGPRPGAKKGLAAQLLKRLEAL